MSQKLTDRTELAENPAIGDLIHVVDISDTADSSQGTSKKVTRKNLVGTTITSETSLISTRVDFYEATNNGVNKKTLRGPTAITANGNIYLPDSDGEITLDNNTQTLTNKTLDTPTIDTATINSPTINTPTITGSNISLSKPRLLGSVQGYESYSPSIGGTATLDLSLANRNTITMPAGNITIALSGANTGQIFTVDITQDGVGSRTVTWFTTIRWAGGAAPTLTTTASKRDSFLFVCTGSNTYDGFVTGFNI